MLKQVIISKDEWYPVYNLYEDDNPSKYEVPLKISTELFDRFIQARKEFREVQSILSELYNE